MRVSQCLKLCVFVFYSCALFAISSLKPQTIDFEQFAGPSLFDSVQSPLKVLSATISNGEILSQATFAPADETTIYGTASFCSGCQPTITIQFSQPVSNFSMFLGNGVTTSANYTVTDDQGHVQTASLPPNDQSGATTFSFPFDNIKSITITSDQIDWDFFIDNLTFTPQGPVLVDPVASSFLRGTSVTTNTSVLANGGVIVQGVAADGAAQAVVRIPTAKTGDTVTVTVMNDQNVPSSSTNDDGGLIILGGNISAVAGMVTLQAVDTGQGPMAFAIYRAPVNFARSMQDNDLAVRDLSLAMVFQADNSSAILNVSVVRPPVVLIHGLWDTRGTWDTFNPLIADSRFFIRRVDYSDLVDGITGSVPSYKASVLATVRENALGFDFNAPNVLSQIQSYISEFRDMFNVAAVKSDVVAHSMGGDISRSLFKQSDFLSNDTFGLGPINKLITIGTPHLGTPLATQMLQTGNSCIQKLLAGRGKPALLTATVSGETVNGAVGDLQGDGHGAGLSQALSSFQSNQPFSTAYIAGVMNSGNLSGIDCFFCTANALRTLCSSNPLAQNLTSQKWPNVFGQDSDGIVPLTSELNNIAGATPFAGVIHSAGVEALSFNGPSELDQASNIPAKVLDLLNEAISGADFHR